MCLLYLSHHNCEVAWIFGVLPWRLLPNNLVPTVCIYMVKRGRAAIHAILGNGGKSFMKHLVFFQMIFNIT